MSSKALDHFVLMVNDLEQGAATYRRLGFHVRPIARHIELGTANAVVHFRNTYLELFNGGDYTGDIIQPYLRRYEYGEGIAHVSLTSGDLEAERNRLQAQGFEPLPVMSARRKITRPDGSEGETDSCFFYNWREHPRYLSLFFSQHNKPETIFIPEYEDHANGAIDVARLVYLSEDPAADVDYFSKSFMQGPDKIDSNGFEMLGSRGEITEVLTAKAAVARYGQNLSCSDPGTLGGIAVAIHYQVKDLARCRDAMQLGAVEFSERDGGVIVPASQACGCALVFED